MQAKKSEVLTASPRNTMRMPGGMRPRLARISRARIELELSKPRGAPDSIIRFNISGVIKYWEAWVGRPMGVTVKSYHWNQDETEMILELSP